METPKNLKPIQFTHFGKEGHFILPLQNYRNIYGIELESFDYKSGDLTSPMIGIAVNGIRGRYNIYGLQSPYLKVVFNWDGKYSYQDQTDEKSDIGLLSSNQQSLEVRFVNAESTSLNKDDYVFNNNYLINFTIYCEE